MEQEENKNYDAWLNWAIDNKCNLACIYCNGNLDKCSGKKFFNSNVLKTFKKIGRKIIDKFSPPPRIDIPALMGTLKKTGKIFGIGFTAHHGEPFLIPNIIETFAELTKNNFISLNTNLIPQKVEHFVKTVNPQKVLVMVASLHIKELERLNLTQKYVDNFLLCRENGFHVVAIEVAHPSLVNEVEKYRKFFNKEGIELLFHVFNGCYNRKQYPYSYTEQELEIFRFRKPDIQEYYNKGKICNAGYNVAWVEPNGDISPCQSIRENMGNIYKEIHFKNTLVKCPLDHCICPLKKYNTYLFNRALKENHLLNGVSEY